MLSHSYVIVLTTVGSLSLRSMLCDLRGGGCGFTRTHAPMLLHIATCEVVIEYASMIIIVIVYIITVC